MSLKNPIALRDGEPIMAKDLGEDERGLACNCICPACGGRLEARLGNVRVHHFSHNGEGCDEVVAFLSGMYMLAKEFIDINEIKLPPLDVYWAFGSERFTEENFFSRIRFESSNGFYNTTNVYPEKTIRFDCSKIIYKNKKPIAMILNHKDSQIALRIKPPATVCKEFKINRYENMATICLDASNVDFGELNKKDITKILLEQIDKWSWIFTNKALKALDEINQKNDLRQNQILNERARALRLEEESARIRRELELMYKQQQREPHNPSKKQSAPIRGKDYTKDIYAKGYEEIKDKDFIATDEPIYDIFGYRWIMCKICSKKDRAENFLEYGGDGSTNLGVCRDCVASTATK